jgi:transposase InsO family protein
MFRRYYGSEFISKALDKWAYKYRIALAFPRPGKPTDNAYIESFNGSFRDKNSNVHWFLSLENAKIKAQNWRQDYNYLRHHSALDYQTPAEFAATSNICITCFFLLIGCTIFGGGSQNHTHNYIRIRNYHLYHNQLYHS